MSKWILSLASVAMLALAMSGCGGSDGSSNVDDGAGTNNGGGTPAPAPIVRDLSDTPNQFGSDIPNVPMIPDMAE